MITNVTNWVGIAVNERDIVSLTNRVKNNIVAQLIFNHLPLLYFEQHMLCLTNQWLISNIIRG